MPRPISRTTCGLLDSKRGTHCSILSRRVRGSSSARSLVEPVIRLCSVSDMRPCSPRVRAGRLELPRCHHQQDLNLPRLPFRHARADKDYRCQTPSSARRRATWPVALTAYCACSSTPSAPITNVDLITPTVTLPYSFFSPQAPYASIT